MPALPTNNVITQIFNAIPQANKFFASVVRVERTCIPNRISIPIVNVISVLLSKVPIKNRNKLIVDVSIYGLSYISKYILL